MESMDAFVQRFEQVERLLARATSPLSKLPDNLPLAESLLQLHVPKTAVSVLRPVKDSAFTSLQRLAPQSAADAASHARRGRFRSGSNSDSTNDNHACLRGTELLHALQGFGAPQVREFALDLRKDRQSADTNLRFFSRIEAVYAVLAMRTTRG